MEKQKDQSAVSSALQTEEREAYDIPVEGSLGLLALGYVGLMLWREKRGALKVQDPLQPVQPLS